MKVEAPEDDCPKCGEPAAFGKAVTEPFRVTGGVPTYRERTWTVERPMKNYNDEHWEEFLAWPCRRCGYEMETPVQPRLPEPPYNPPHHENDR